MSILKLFALTNLLCVLMAGDSQIDSFEKQALSLVQAMPASDLDAKLPGRSFASWLQQLIGAKAGMVWQLTECGSQSSTSYERKDDLPACAEITALLPDKRRVFITISVGTFKEGLTGKPAFFSAVIEHKAELFSVRQLYDLPEMLGAPEAPAGGPINKRLAKKTKKRIVNLPTMNGGQVKLAMLPHHTLAPSSNFPGVRDLEEPPSPPPQDLESVLQSRVITRVNPVYPPNARKLNATGTVQVEVTISEAGIVLEAKAISGHLALRNAAVEAARKWVFKPAIFNDAPVKIKGVLSFTFGPGSN